MDAGFKDEPNWFNTSYFISAITCWLCLISVTYGEETVIWTAESGVATSLQDDATIHDICFAGRDQVWAVGNQGAVWFSSTGGATWQFVQLDSRLQKFHFHSVQFLTDRVGWIAGGNVSKVGRIHQGIILHTTDGGQSWKVISSPSATYIRKVHFFDLENGYALGERSATFPSGVMQTTDSGLTWQPVSGKENSRWESAAFFNRHAGLLIGDKGRQSVLTDGALLTGGANIGGLQGYHAVSVQPDGTCWVVGDGGVALSSRDYGVTWTPIVQFEQPEKRDLINFHAVDQHQDDVWLAGFPGKVIWHSADRGRSWKKQFTGSTSPLEVVRFRDQKHGVAAGAFGRICLTTDSGQTWRDVRGGERRLACWAFHAHASRVPLQFLARWSAESGMRSGVTIAARRDEGSEQESLSDRGLYIPQAVLHAGANFGEIDWRLPMLQPGIDKDEKKLTAELARLTDQQFHGTLLRNLVGRIRTWQPTLILVDEPPANDALTRLMQTLLPEAVEAAANSEIFTEQLELGLGTWQVQKVVMQRIPGASGTVTQDAQEILPRLGTTLDKEAKQAFTIAFPEQQETSQALSYEVIYLAPSQNLSQRTLFHDLALAPGTPPRRELRETSQADLEKLIAEVAHRKRVTNLSKALIAQPEGGSQLLGQINEMLQPLSPEQASQQLSDLALAYRRHANWAMAEETYAQLIMKYPEQPEAVEAMLWLVKYATSAEMNWQRLRAVNASRSNMTIDKALVHENFEKALESATRNVTQVGFQQEVQFFKENYEENSTALQPTLGGSPGVLNGSQGGVNQYDAQLQRWHSTAAHIVNDLSAAYPRLFENDELQFVVAALMRRRKQNRNADEIYDKYLQKLNDDDPWHVSAKGEVFLLRPGALSPKPVVNCKQASIPPVLDGKLTDPNWTNAKEIRLTDQHDQDLFVGSDQSLTGSVDFLEPEPIVMFSRDDEYLYIAASVPKHRELEYVPVQQAGRQRDAAIGGRDYLSIQIDIDRDYSTYYRFDVDQRGWSRESCWDSWSYNPEWFIASQQDATTWEFEAAIPLKELVATGAEHNGTWAVGVTRIMPGVGVQSWTGSGGEIPVPPRFGFLKFD